MTPVEVIPDIPRRGFIEYTKTDHGHGGPGWEFGTCLWSPSRSAAGSDIYALMREPEPGDLVVHFLDGDLTGYSWVAKRCAEVLEQPPTPGPWSDRPEPYYRIELEGFTEFGTPIPTKQILETYAEEIEREILQGAEQYPFNTGKLGLARNQGMYLTALTPTLRNVFNQALGMAPETLEDFEPASAGPEEYYEGRRRVREVAYFARHPKLAKRAREKYGYVCQICGFDYKARYGQLGEGYVEVHHLNPLSERPETENVDLPTGLDEVIVVCANCHRMLHRKRPALTPAELRDQLSD